MRAPGQDDPLERARALLTGLSSGDTSSALREELEALAAADPNAAQRLDPWLLALRAREIADAQPPAQIAGLLRGRLLGQDAISTVWEAWDPVAGERVALRMLAARWANDPVLLRRLRRGAVTARGLDGVASAEWVEHPDWPQTRFHLGGPSLADLLPCDGAPDSREIARCLVAGLRGLRSLHAQGLAHGGLTAHHLIVNPTGYRLAWFDPVLREVPRLRSDLAALGVAVSALDPWGETPLGELALAFAEDPPPSSDAAASLLRRVLAEDLATRRHRLRLLSRRARRFGRRERLLATIRRLERAVRPPAGAACLRASWDAVIVVLEGDGEVFRGGPVAGLPARFLPRVFDPQIGLEPVAARACLRAFATRGTGDEDRRAALTLEMGGGDAWAAAVCRWLAGQARLRSLRLLLERAG